MNSNQLASHLQVEQYGDFRLTDAIRPSLDLQVIPSEGFRVETYQDARAELRVPVLAAAVSAERLFETFLALLEPLSEVVDVVLETSHDRAEVGHRDLYREHIDRPVLASYFCEFEDLLVNDGCTGVAVVATEKPIEVQFDEHKLLIVYAQNLKPFQKILEDAGLLQDDGLKLITEGEHLHATDARFMSSFEQLSYRLGAGKAAEHVNW